MTGSQAQRVLPRWLIAMLGVTTIVIAVAGTKAAASVIAPIFFALVLTVTVQPVLVWAKRQRIPEWLAILLTVLVVDAGLIGLAVAMVASVGRLVDLLPEYADQWAAVLGNVRSFLEGIGVTPDQVETALRSIDPSTVVDLVTGLIGSLGAMAGGLVFVLATVMFMTVDANSLAARLDDVPGVRPGLGAALSGFARSTRSYLWVTTLFGLVVALLDTVALWILDIPLALVWGLLAFLTNYIPNVGFVIGVIPPALLGLLVGGPSRAVLVVVVYCVINFLLQSVVQPKFVGDAVGLSITVTFLSLIVWTWVLGPLGSILAVPLTLLVKAVLLDHDPGNRWALALVSSSHGTRTAEETAADPAETPTGKATGREDPLPAGS